MIAPVTTEVFFIVGPAPHTCTLLVNEENT